MMAPVPGDRGRAGRRQRVAALWAMAGASMLASLLLAAPLPAAGQPAPLPAGSAAAPDRSAYLQRVQVEMDGWRMKLHGMTDKAEATGQVDATEAEANLRLAWDRTEVQARNLQTATAAGWESAKSSFEQSSLDLSHAWSKSRL